MNAYTKLFNIQQKLKAPKNQYNKFGNYNYRSCEDILTALKPLLKKQQAMILINDEVIEVGGKNYIKATVKFIDIETGESVETSALARESEAKKGMDASQITGSCSSYARKYALNAMFAIDDTKDSDATNKHGKDEVKTEPTLIKQVEAPAPKKAEVTAGPQAEGPKTETEKTGLPIKNIWTKPKEEQASETDNVIPLEKHNPSEDPITKSEMMFIFSRGFQAGYSQDQVKNHIIKKFNKTIDQLTKRECLTIVEGYQNKILKRVEG